MAGRGAGMAREAKKAGGDALILSSDLANGMGSRASRNLVHLLPDFPKCSLQIVSKQKGGDS